MARDSIRFQSEVVKMARGYNSCCRLNLFRSICKRFLMQCVSKYLCRISAKCYISFIIHDIVYVRRRSLYCAIILRAICTNSYLHVLRKLTCKRIGICQRKVIILTMFFNVIIYSVRIGIIMPEFVLKVHQFYYFLRPRSQGTRNVAISSRCGNMHITLFPDMRKIAPCLNKMMIIPMHAIYHL